MDRAHPAVKYLYESMGDYYVSGKLTKVESPKHYDYKLLRHTPDELKDQFDKLGWEKVVAFQTRNPMHRAHKEIAYRAAIDSGANLLIHPVVGQTKPGDIDHYTRVRCYQRILNYFQNRNFPEAYYSMDIGRTYPLSLKLHLAKIGKIINLLLFVLCY